MSKKYPGALTADDIGKVIRFHVTDRAYVEDTISEIRHERRGANDRATLVRVAHLRPSPALNMRDTDGIFYTLNQINEVEIR